MFRSRHNNQIENIQINDYGPDPLVINIDYITKQNTNYRSTLWTGEHLQVTLMSITDEIGLEVHDYLDQFIRIEDGYGLVMMGNDKDHLTSQVNVGKDDAIIVPAGTWHNLINRGKRPLKLYSIYAPPQHPFDTQQRTREEAEAAERYY